MYRLFSTANTGTRFQCTSRLNLLGCWCSDTLPGSWAVAIVTPLSPDLKLSTEGPRYLLEPIPRLTLEVWTHWLIHPQGCDRKGCRQAAGWYEHLFGEKEIYFEYWYISNPSCFLVWLPWWYQHWCSNNSQKCRNKPYITILHYFRNWRVYPETRPTVESDIFN